MDYRFSLKIVAELVEVIIYRCVKGINFLHNRKCTEVEMNRFHHN